MIFYAVLMTLCGAQLGLNHKLCFFSKSYDIEEV